MSEKKKMPDQFGEILDVLNTTLEAGGFNTFQRIGEMSAVIRLNGIQLLMQGKIKKGEFVGVSFRQAHKLTSHGTRPVVAPEDVFRKYIKAQEKINREYWGGKEAFL